MRQASFTRSSAALRGGTETVGPIVLVTHGATHLPALDRLLAQTRRPVVRVQTDGAAGLCVADLNEAYEFSGYQEGLGRVLRDLPEDSNDPVIVTFANDTMATGHLSCVARGLLETLAWRHCSRSEPPALTSPRMLGWRMPLNAAVGSLCGSDGYFSTWAFTLVGRPRDLAHIRFYGPLEVGDRFDAVWAGLPAAYKRWSDEWLAPTHWLRGWYKACPGRPLDDETRKRKRVSIYLEHTLALRLTALGFQTMDVSEAVGARLATRLRFLRGLDKLNVNRLKLAHRLPQMLRWRA